MKTFAIKLRAPIRISGIEFPGDYQIGAVTSEVNPIDLLGLIQFHHASVEEVTDAADDEIEEGDEAEQVEVESPVADEQAVDLAADQPLLPLVEDSQEVGQAQPEIETSSQPETESQPTEIDDPAAAIALFVADGLDDKTARALVVVNKIASPDALRAKLAESTFSLADLDEIGQVRQEKILATYLK